MRIGLPLRVFSLWSRRTHRDRPLLVSWSPVLDHNGMVERDQEALKGLYPNFGCQSWTRVLRRIKYLGGPSKWNIMVPCAGQPTVVVVAEARGTQFPCCLLLRLEGDILI